MSDPLSETAADSIASLADVELLLPAQRTSVPIVRRALDGLADGLMLDGTALDDVKIAVSEACTNVVRHAYEGEDGPLAVRLAVENERLTAVVEDVGAGLASHAAQVGEDHGLGLGLPLMASLAVSIEVDSEPNAGTRVSMAFALDPEATAGVAPVIEGSALGRWEHDTGDGVRLSVSAGPCAEPVLARVIGIVASEADFVFDRLSDAQLLGGAIAERAAEHASDGRIAVGLWPGEHQLELRLGPLVPGGGRALMREAEVPGFGPLVERLADEVAVEERDPGEEFLRARLGAGLS